MLKPTTIIFSLLIISCGSKSDGSENQKNQDKGEKITTEKPQDCFDYKINKREDIYGYWKDIKNDESNIVYYIDESSIKKCELLKASNKIISNNSHEVEWFRNEEFSYKSNNSKVNYYVFKFNYAEIKRMSFKENDKTVHLESLENTSNKEELALIKEKCNL
jgi:hypothetical protein